MKVTVRLDEELIKKFSEVKEYLGIKDSGDVFRFLLVDYWRKIKREKNES